MSNVSISNILYCPFKLAVSLIMLITALQTINANAFSPPDQPGPYKVGHLRVDHIALDNGKETNVSIWYPTNDTGGQPANYETNPTVDTYTFPQFTTFILPSLFNAKENAAMATGHFPVIIASSGSAGINRDRGRMQFYKRAEFLATHGFVTLGYTYHTPLQNFSTDIEDVMAFVLGPSSPVKDIIDPNKVAVVGISAGGYPALSIASGNTFIAKDNRVKALIWLDAVMGNDQNDYNLLGNPFNLIVPSLIFHLQFNGDANKLVKRSEGTPKISIFQKKVHHFSTVDYCPIIDACREVAFAKGLPDPLMQPTADLNSTIASSLWRHIGEYYCETSHWTTAVPLDLVPNRSNYTPENENFRRVTLFMVSFLKTYLSDETGYEYYLTEEYSRDNFESGDLTLKVEEN